MQAKLSRIISVDFDIINHQIFYIHQIPDQKHKYNGALQELLVDFITAHNSDRQDAAENTLKEFSIPPNPVRLIKIRLNETYSKVPTDRHLIHFLFGMV
jgi:uncharacterized protein YueI